MSGDQLREAASRGQLHMLKDLLAGGANPCSQDKHGLTPLHYAVWNGYIECVETLLVNPKGHVPIEDDKPKPKLKRGEKRHERALETTSTNLQSHAGYTALHIACMGGVHAEPIAKLLLMGGVSPDLKDSMGRTALAVARERGARDLVMTLEYGLPTPEAKSEYIERTENERGVQGKGRAAHLAVTNKLGVEAIAAVHADLRVLEDAEREKYTRHDLEQSGLAADKEALGEEAYASGAGGVGRAGSAAADKERRRARVIGARGEAARTAARLPPCPPELLMHEHKILPFATLNFNRRVRGPMPLRNLVIARSESEANEGRRDLLAHSREINLRAIGDNAAADMAALEQANAGQVFKAGKEKEAKAAGSSKKKKKVVPG